VSVALAGAIVLAGGPVAATAADAGAAPTVVTKHLDGPFGLQSARAHRGFLVAESVSGQVTRVFDSGRQRTIISGAPGVAGVAGSPRRVFAVTGGPPPPGEGAAPPAGRIGVSRVVRATYNGKGVKVIANLLAYERKHNPDGQRQFVKGKPVDALSNPFAMTWSRFGLLVADGGANDVLKVNPRTGHVSTFFVPSTVKDVPACKGKDANSNPGTKGCDPVPTGVDVVGDSVYVSTLGAEAPRAGRVYKLDARSGKVQRVWKGFTAPTGVAARRDGTFYVSEVLYGAPAGDPPPGFDPSSVGRLTRVKDGHRTHSSVTMPTGLELKHGHLFASAWSIASFVGIQHAGQVVRVPESAFH